MKAVLSDIHGNLEALHAVLNDIHRHPVECIYCLGDISAYGGPDPRGCADLAMQWRIVLRGNHDQALFNDPDGYGPTAYRAMRWATAQLELPIPDRCTAEHRWCFLRELPKTYREGDYIFVHGSPHNPLHEYVFPEDIYFQRKMERIFSLIVHACFVGHSHVPGIFTEDGQFRSPEELDYKYRFDGRKTLVNVGAVGQPRDGDWRACYALLDGDLVRFRRVKYDVDATVRKIYETPELENSWETGSEKDDEMPSRHQIKSVQTISYWSRHSVF